MRIIGITGGVGSGKSAVLDFLAKHDAVAVIDADKVAHQLQDKGRAGYEEIVKVFGQEVLDSGGIIDRGKLGAIVFHDEGQLLKLNAIMHPLVKQEIMRQLQEYAAHMSVAYVFIEAALLIEEHYDEICDELWYIYVQEEQRMQRLKQSRGYSEEKIIQMMGCQLEEEVFRRHCQVVIDNNGSIEETYRQIREVLAWQN